mgnify:CR=1 FL=1
MVRANQLLHPQREPVATRPAATVLLLRDGPDGVEVLMTRRSLTASFAPGAYVFPGGGIDAADAAAHVADLSTRLWTAPLDVRDAARVEQVVARAEAALGPLHGLASVAGVLEMGDVVDLEDAQWARCFDINASGVFHICRSVARRLRERRPACQQRQGNQGPRTPYHPIPPLRLTRPWPKTPASQMNMTAGSR